MVKRTIYAILALILLGCPFRQAEGMTHRVSFRDENQSVSHNRSGVLAIEYRQFVVEAGRLDSVTAGARNAAIWQTSAAVSQTRQVSTFAGDSQHDPDYYVRRLCEIAANEDGESINDLIVDRLRLGDQQLVTVALSVGGRSSETTADSRLDYLDLEFYGDTALRVREATEKELGVFMGSSATPGRSSTNADKADAATAEYLLITSNELLESFMPLLEWKRIKGLTVGYEIIEDILNTYSGVDAAEKLRNCLIDRYNTGTGFVLLGGDENVLPVRYAYHSNTSEMPELNLLQLCDLYFADVDGEWDVDGDGVWGEPTQDSPDLYPELLLGRVLVDTPAEVSRYVDKLIKYEQNPNNGDYDYLNRSLFVSADQMRDYQGVGQHNLIAEVMPPSMDVDLTRLVEDPSGVAENPIDPSGPTAIDVLAEGWGVVSLLVHGNADACVVRANMYNQWPKAYFFTAEGSSGTHGFLPNMESNNMPGLVYSIGCNNGAFDMDSPPFTITNPCMAEAFLLKEDGGAVAFVGNARWGWVASSWKLEKAFLEYLYGIDNNVAAAQRYSKLQYSYYRDLNYGLNLFGDPQLSIWTESPLQLAVDYSGEFEAGATSLEFVVHDQSQGLDEVIVSVTMNGEVIVQGVTTADGSVTLEFEFNIEDQFEVYAFKDGYATGQAILSPQIVLDTEDETPLPEAFALFQNYPNPFNPGTVIEFTLDRSELVTVEVFNILGQLVDVVTSTNYTAGKHRVDWNGTNSSGKPQSSGVYFARVSAGTRTDVIKMTMLK